MSEKPKVPTDREVRQLFGQVCDQAADVAAKFRPCRCNEKSGTPVGSDLSNEALRTKLARLESQVSTLNQRTTTSTDGRPESPINIGLPVEPARAPRTLMGLPRKVRGLIWWQALRPEDGFVNLVPWQRVGYLDKGGRIRIGIGGFHRARSAMIDRRLNPFDGDQSFASRAHARSWERAGENSGAPWTDGWALLHVNKQVYAEAEADYWKGVNADDLMLSFGCDIRTGDYYGLAVARTFFNDFTAQYLQTIRRMHLDLRRPDYDDGPNGYGGQALVVRRAGVRQVNFVRALGAVLTNIGTKLTSLRHLSLTIGGWVPDVRQTPWIEDTDYPDVSLQTSQQWVTRLQNITGLTRLRLRVIYAPRDPATINAKLDQDSGVQRTIHFMSMLRGSMLVNGAALGVGNMRAWANQRWLEFATADRFRIVVQCDDSWDEKYKEHRHHIEPYDYYDPIDGLNDFEDQFSWDPDAIN